MELPFADKTIEITVRYAMRKDGGVEVIRNKKQEKRFKEVSELSTTWKPLSLNEFTDLTSQATIFDEEHADMDLLHYRQALMEHAMTNWNLEGFPCAAEHMRRLDANIANYLIDEYVKRTTQNSSLEGDPLYDYIMKLEERVNNVEALLTQIMIKLDQRDTGETV